MFPSSRTQVNTLENGSCTKVIRMQGHVRSNIVQSFEIKKKHQRRFVIGGVFFFIQNHVCNIWIRYETEKNEVVIFLLITFFSVLFHNKNERKLALAFL